MNYGMVIDQQKCVGCSACVFACKAENHTPAQINWCDPIIVQEGTYPNVRFEYISTLCNHCGDAPCVRSCPTQAMHKSEWGLTLHEPERCIGCKACMINCPYGVISFNWNRPHQSWQRDHPIAQGSFSGASMLAATGGVGSPHSNPESANHYPSLRWRGTVEKCTFCVHRLEAGLNPACVDACPSQARTVGDLDDPNSVVSRLIERFNGQPLRPQLGLRPKIFYVRTYTPQETKGEI